MFRSDRKIIEPMYLKLLELTAAVGTATLPDSSALTSYPPGVTQAILSGKIDMAQRPWDTQFDPSIMTATRIQEMTRDLSQSIQSKPVTTMANPLHRQRVEVVSPERQTVTSDELMNRCCLQMRVAIANKFGTDSVSRMIAGKVHDSAMEVLDHLPVPTYAGDLINIRVPIEVIDTYVKVTVHTSGEVTATLCAMPSPGEMSGDAEIQFDEDMP